MIKKIIELILQIKNKIIIEFSEIFDIFLEELADFVIIRWLEMSIFFSKLEQKITLKFIKFILYLANLGLHKKILKLKAIQIFIFKFLIIPFFFTNLLIYFDLLNTDWFINSIEIKNNLKTEIPILNNLEIEDFSNTSDNTKSLNKLKYIGGGALLLLSLFLIYNFFNNGDNGLNILLIEQDYNQIVNNK